VGVYSSNQSNPTSGYFFTSSYITRFISASFSEVVASNLRVRFGLVLDARTAPQSVSLKWIRTPSRVMQSCRGVKWSTKFLTISNFLSSGQYALYSGVMYVFGRSSKSFEKGLSCLARTWRILRAPSRASSNP